MSAPEGGRVEERRRIGELLLEAGVIRPEQLREALEEQRRHGGRLCYNLIRLGHLRAEDLVGFLRDQFGVAAVDLERYQVPAEVLALVPAEFARQRRIVPLHLLDRTLTVAMVDPSRGNDVDALRELTGLEPDPVISPEASVEAALARFYPSAGEAGAFAEGVLDLEEEGEGRAAPPAAAGGADDWLRRFLLQGIKRRSREVHLEPAEAGLRARYRVRGALQEGETAPGVLRPQITRRALALAGIAGTGRPAEGRFRVQIRGRWLRATLSAFPTLRGERLVIRIVDESLLAREFQELGMSKEVADEMQRLLGLRQGMILLNAPPGSGGTTTFYSCLTHLRGEGGRNVMTLESPVRLPLEGVSQTSLTGQGGLDFASGIQALLHQEPDAVGLADLPDRRALEAAFAAARRCLVVAQCAFRDNLQALEWVRDSGVGTPTQGLLLRGILAQRLLPKICSACREPATEPVQLLEGFREKRPEELAFYTGQGCEQCGGTGRNGRVALFELLSFRGELRDMLLRGAPLQLVFEEAQRQGMWTLREDGVLKASLGLVDVREVIEATAQTGSFEG